jgi:hypothetical protein
MPLPSQEHFLFDISAEDKANFQAMLEEQFKAAHTDAVERVTKPLEKLLEKLNKYTGASEERFHTSLVTNVIEGAIKTKDLTFDPPSDYLDKVDELQDFANRISVDSIKENPTYRESVKDELQKIADAMAMFAPM